MKNVYEKKFEKTRHLCQEKLVVKRYANNLYFTTQNEKEVDFFLELIKDFEKASNELLCKDKCQLISIVNDPKKRLKYLQGIKQATKVSCLGIYFDHNWNCKQARPANQERQASNTRSRRKDHSSKPRSCSSSLFFYFFFTMALRPANAFI